jgi:hypothetical protein
MKLFLLINIILLSMCSNSISAQSSSCGYVEYKMLALDTIHNAYVHLGVADRKILYEDSTVIIPSNRIYTKTMNGVLTEWYQKADYYTFIDLHAKGIFNVKKYTKDSNFYSTYNATFYEYEKLENYAPIRRMYNNIDTGVAHTWVFFTKYIFKNALDTIGQVRDSVIRLADTTINNQVYKRNKLWRMNSEGVLQVVSIQYWLCDVKKWMLIFAPDVDKEGCIYAGQEYQRINPQKQTWISDRIEYHSGGLSKDEKKVFKAWIKNAKKNPIK